MKENKIQLKAGLEIHQQLETHKLFCECPSILRNDEPEFTVKRKLNPVVGETGHIDTAAAFEKLKNETFIYKVYDTNCLVELDEEPPHKINSEALKITLQIAELFNCKIFPVTQIMRKTVVDGSNTSGFQRTVLIAHDGFIETSEGKVRIETIALEEDAARPDSGEDDDENIKTYKLDRLGIPLVEITTKPDLKSPEQIKEAALKIGEILRACNVKRGIGTIRQDLNISILGGKRVEIKGFQNPKIMIQTVLNEIQRQKTILELKDKFESAKIDDKITNLTDLLKNTKCKIIQKGISEKKQLSGFKITNLKGILGIELNPGKRIGTDFSEYSKPKSKIGGIIHSDEDLKKYEISKEEILEIKKHLNIKQNDAFILIIGTENQGEITLEAIKDRIELLKHGNPNEVRKSNPNATTSFLRPMPGSARMYPETDHSLLKISRDLINEVKNNLPKLASENKAYLKKFGLNEELISLLLKQNKLEEFKSLLKTFNNPNIIAKILVIFLPEIAKKGNKSSEQIKEILNEDVLHSILKEVKLGKLSENHVKPTMQLIAQGKEIKDALTEEEIDIRSIIKDLIKQKPKLSPNAYMGLIMSKYKGRVNGKEVMEEINELLK